MNSGIERDIALQSHKNPKNFLTVSNISVIILDIFTTNFFEIFKPIFLAIYSVVFHFFTSFSTYFIFNAQFFFFIKRTLQLLWFIPTPLNFTMLST